MIYQPQPPFANPHAVVAMPESWHGFFDIFKDGQRDGGCGCFVRDGCGILPRIYD